MLQMATSHLNGPNQRELEKRSFIRVAQLEILRLGTEERWLLSEQLLGGRTGGLMIERQFNL